MKITCSQCFAIVESDTNQFSCPQCGHQSTYVFSARDLNQMTRDKEEQTRQLPMPVEVTEMSILPKMQWWFIPLASFIVCVAYGLWFTHLGLTITGDSMAYLSTSLKFQRTGVFEIAPLWPPLYPWLISQFDLFTDFPADAAAWLSGVSFGTLFFAVLSIAHLLRLPKTSLLAIAVFLCCWWEVIFVYQAVWSGGVFTSLWALHLLFVMRHIRRGQILDFVGMAVTTGMLIQTRYIGYCLGPSLLVYGLWQLQKRSWKERGLYVLIGGIALLPHLKRLQYNIEQSGELHGSRRPSTLSLSDSFSGFWDSLYEATTSLPLLALLILMAMYCFRNPLDSVRAFPQKSAFFYYTVLSIVSYAGILVYSAANVAIDLVTPETNGIRFVVPLLPPLLIASIIGVRVLWTQWREYPMWSLLLPVSLMGSLFLGFFKLEDGAGSKWLHSYFERGHHRGYVQTGFSQSQTAEQIGALINSELDNREQVALLLMDNIKQSKKYKAVGLRKAIFSDSLKFLSYGDIGGSAMELLVLHKQQNKKVVLNGYSLVNQATLEQAILQVAQGAKSRDVLLLGRKNLLKKMKMNSIFSDFSNKATCFREGAIPPYVVYRCTVAIVDDSFVSITEVKEGELLISELMLSTTKVADHRGEWFELYNAGDRAINLNGLEMENERTSHVFAEDIGLLPNDFALFGLRNNPKKNGGVDGVDALYPLKNLNFGYKGEFRLKSGERIIDSIEYDLRKNKSSFSGVSFSYDHHSKSGLWCPSRSQYGDGDIGTPKSKNDSCENQSMLFDARSGGEKIFHAEGLAQVPPSSIVISEIMRGPKEDQQWIELYNTGNATVNLKGLRVFSSEEDGFVVDEDVMVEGNAYALFSPMYGMLGVDFVYQPKELNLNEAEQLRLFGPLDVLMDAVQIGQLPDSENSSFYTNADGEGNDDIASWCQSEVSYLEGYFGSPKAVNPACGSVRSQIELVISEIFIEPTKVKGYRGEWFEVYNPMSQAVSLKGIQFLSNEDQSFSIYNDLTIPAGEYAIFSSRQNPKINGGIENVLYEYNINEFSLVFNDFIEIRDGRTVIDRVEFIAGKTHPKVKGKSLVLRGLSAETNDLPSEWCVASSSYGDGDQGTPGAQNDPCP